MSWTSFFVFFSFAIEVIESSVYFVYYPQKTLLQQHLLIVCRFLLCLYDVLPIFLICSNVIFRRNIFGSENIYIDSPTSNIKNWYIFLTEIVYFNTKILGWCNNMFRYNHLQLTYMYFMMSFTNVYFEYYADTVDNIVNYVMRKYTRKM